jgi:hypothetical protein
MCKCVNAHQMCQCAPSVLCDKHANVPTFSVSTYTKCVNVHPMANVPMCQRAMSQCANLPMCQCAHAPMCQCANVPMCQCVNMPTCNVPICQCANVRTCNVPIYQCASMPTRQCANVPMCQCANIRWANMTVLMHRNTHIRATSRCACPRRAAPRP